MRGRADPVWWMEKFLGLKLWSKQKQIARSFQENKRTAVCSCNSIGKCRKFTDFITLSDGRCVQFGSLIGKEFTIPGFNPETGEQKPVLAFAESNGEREVLEIETAFGRKIGTTTNHPVWVADRTYQTAKRRLVIPKNPRWMDVSEVVPGKHLVAVPRSLNVTGTKERPEREIKLCAYLLADGGLTGGHVRYSKSNPFLVEEMREISNSFGCQLHPVRGDDCSWGISTPAGQPNPIRRLVQAWGIDRLSKEKSFPDWIWTLPNNQLCLFLNRLFTSDGWCCGFEKTGATGYETKRARVAISLASEQMIRDIELALLRLGICGMVRERSMTCAGKRFPAWEWASERTEDFLRFKDTVGMFSQEEKLETLAAALTPPSHLKERKWRHLNAPPGFFWDDVKSVMPLGPLPTVAICVPGGEAYTTTFAEHNTTITAGLIIWALQNHPNSVAAVTSPTWRQVVNNVWREVRTLYERAPVSLGPPPNRGPIWEVGAKHYAFGFSARDPEKVAGVHAPYVFLFLDEASGIPQGVFNGIQGLLASGHVRMLLTGNPTQAEGEFYKAFTASRDMYNPIEINAWDTPNLAPIKDYCLDPNTTQAERLACLYAADAGAPYKYLVMPGWVADMERQYGMDGQMYKVCVLGQFTAGAPDDLVSLALVQAAAIRWHEMFEGMVGKEEQALSDSLIRRGINPSRKEMRTEEPWWTNPDAIQESRAGLDVARFGNAESVFCPQLNGIVAPMTSWSGRSVDQLVKDVQAPIEGMMIESTNVDADGLGAAHFDLLRAWATGMDTKPFGGWRPNIREFHGGTPARNSEEFFNRRAEGYFGLEERYREGRIAHPNYPKLVGQISTIKYKFRASGQKIIESKEDMQKRGLVSPDWADSEMMAFVRQGGVRGVSVDEREMEGMNQRGYGKGRYTDNHEGRFSVMGTGFDAESNMKSGINSRDNLGVAASDPNERPKKPPSHLRSRMQPEELKQYTARPDDEEDEGFSSRRGNYWGTR